MKINITGRNIDEYASTSVSIPVSSFGHDEEIPFVLAQYFAPQCAQGIVRELISLRPMPLVRCIEEHLREEGLERQCWQEENYDLSRMHNIVDPETRAILTKLFLGLDFSRISIILSRLGVEGNSVVDPETRATLTKDFLGLDFSQASKIFDNLGKFVLIPSIFSISSLTSLNLFGSNLGVYGSSILADGLKHSNLLGYLKIAYDDMGQEGQLELAQGLAANHSLTTLDLSNEVPVDAADLPYLFNINLPDLAVADRIVNSIRYSENNELYFGDFLACSVVCEKYVNSSPILFRTIGQHRTIKYFCFGVITDDSFFTFLSSRMLKVKGLVVQSVFHLANAPDEVSPQLSYLTNFKARVEQVNDGMVNSVISMVQELAAVPEVCLPRIAKYIGFINLMASVHDNPILLPVEVQEFIGNNYLSLLLLTLRKNQGNSLLEQLPSDVHKNVASFMFNFQLGENLVEYRAQPYSEEREAIGEDGLQYGDDFLLSSST